MVSPSTPLGTVVVVPLSTPLGIPVMIPHGISSHKSGCAVICARIAANGISGHEWGQVVPCALGEGILQYSFESSGRLLRAGML